VSMFPTDGLTSQHRRLIRARSLSSSAWVLALCLQPQIPQVCHIVGGVLSPVLANLTLDGLEGALKKAFPPGHRKGTTSRKVHLVRYADDVRRFTGE